MLQFVSPSCRDKSVATVATNNKDLQDRGHDNHQIDTPCQIQPKLTVGSPNDPLEHEADAVADRVMRMPENSYLQRKCEECEKEEEVQKKSLSDSVSPAIQTKSDGNTPVQESTSCQIKSSLGSGSSLDRQTNNFMSQRFGHNFNDVKIHNDSHSAKLSNDLHAKAFTVGKDIFFNSGQLDTESSEGKKLLAHELTHTMQQSKYISRWVQRSPNQASQRQTAISAARARAFHRVSVAYLRINGTSPNFNQSEELQTVRGLIAPDIVNFDQIVEIVGSFLSKLGADSNIVIGPEISQCTGAMGWEAYVTGNRLPIHLCNRFFTKTPEEQTRTLIHEAAHAAGIGEPVGESYFPIFDCSHSQADNWRVADAWARYIHCISGQTPD